MEQKVLSEILINPSRDVCLLGCELGLEISSKNKAAYAKLMNAGL